MDGGGDVDVELAKGIELPVAETSAPWPRPIRIAITQEGKLRIDGRPVNHAGLADELRKQTTGTHDATRAVHPSRRDAVILADHRVRWREVQWAMQALGDPSVRVYRVPFAEVIRILDTYRKAGRGAVTFVGAPPPPK